jgi:hypothetical protein
VVDLHAWEPGREVVDHVVPAHLSVGDDVDARRLLVLDGRLDRRIMDLLEVMPGEAAVEVVVLGPLEPARHRVAPDDGGEQDRVRP